MSDEIPLREIWRPKMNVNLELNYRMDHPRRGKAIIFNHYRFAIPDLGARDGTHNDVDMFREVLIKWGFLPQDIIVKTDLTLRGIEDHLYDLANKTDHTDYDMFVCAVFTHGERNSIYSQDSLYPTSTLWKHFTDTQCPSLRGKPKLFLIQACRGSKLDPGVEGKTPPKCHSQPILEDLEKPTIEVTQHEEFLVISSTDKIILREIAKSEGIATTPSPDILDTEIDSSPIPEIKSSVSRHGSTGSIQSIPSNWYVGESPPRTPRRKLSFLERPLQILPRNRAISENEFDHTPVVKFSAPRRSSAPQQVPMEWLKGKSETTDALAIGKDKEVFQTPHSDSDILVAYSTADGYYSFRRPSHGSWFVTVLSEIVRTMTDMEQVEIHDLFTVVNRQVAIDMESYVTHPRKKIFDRKKQISCFHSTLTKRVFFPFNYRL